MLGELSVFWAWKSGLFKPSLGNYENQNGSELALPTFTYWFLVGDRGM